MTTIIFNMNDESFLIEETKINSPIGFPFEFECDDSDNAITPQISKQLSKQMDYKKGSSKDSFQFNMMVDDQELTECYIAQVKYDTGDNNDRYVIGMTINHWI